MSQHAYFAPSSAGIWGECPTAAVALNSNTTKDRRENERARQGTAAHWLAAEYLTSGRLFDYKSDLGHVAPNDVIIDSEIITGVGIYLDDILSICRSSQNRFFGVETPCSMSDIHPNCWGTPDFWIVQDDCLYLWDYKHGHAEVNAKGNRQMALYIKGIINAIGYTPGRIEVHVVQPFAYTSNELVKIWACEQKDLEPIWTKLHYAAHMSASGKAVAGPHCRYCPAIAYCNTRRKSDFFRMDEISDDEKLNPLSAEQMAFEYKTLADYLPILKSRIGVLETELINRISSGEMCSMSIESTPGRLKWAVSSLAVQAALSTVGIDPRQEECKTPRQIAMSLPSKDRKDFYNIIKDLTTQTTSYKLIDSADTLAGRVFGRRE